MQLRRTLLIFFVLSLILVVLDNFSLPAISASTPSGNLTTPSSDRTTPSGNLTTPASASDGQPASAIPDVTMGREERQ